MINLLVTPKREDLMFVKGLLEAGALVPVIDRRYSLEVPEALGYLAEGRARGEVVIVA